MCQQEKPASFVALKLLVQLQANDQNEAWRSQRSRLVPGMVHPSYTMAGKRASTKQNITGYFLD